SPSRPAVYFCSHRRTNEPSARTRRPRAGRPPHGGAGLLADHLVPVHHDPRPARRSGPRRRGRAATDLTAIYLILLPAGLDVRATRILGRRGYRAPPLQQAAWFGGLALMAVALLSPIDSLGETDLLSAHMAQHLLIADL